MLQPQTTRCSFSSPLFCWVLLNSIFFAPPLCLFASLPALCKPSSHPTNLLVYQSTLSRHCKSPTTPSKDFLTFTSTLLFLVVQVLPHGCTLGSFADFINSVDGMTEIKGAERSWIVGGSVRSDLGGGGQH